MADRPDPTRSVSPPVDPAHSGAGADPAATTDGEIYLAVACPAPASTGRYELGNEIARGGMGVVYRATDAAFGREVALKVLQEKFGPASGAARRFADEARITGQLQHPAIPPVHDLGALPDGRPFLAMKLIRGDTLDRLLAGRTDPAADRGRFVAAFDQVCQAVAYAHARHVIHRDLKPLNVMVGSYGEVQVMDWGLAKELRTDAPVGSAVPDAEVRAVQSADPARTTDHHPADESTDDRTRAGQAMGTPAFMPPEQARGEVERVDRRSDVFALGGLLCVVLTGKPPYTGTTTGEVVRKAAAGELGDAMVRLDGCGADADLVALCKRCLSLDPTDRPADAAEVAGLVAGYRAGVEQRLRAAERERAAAAVQAGEQRKRRKVQLALAAAVGLLLLGGGAFAWQQDRQAAEHRADRQRAASEKQATELRQQVKDGEAAAENHRAVADLVKRCEDSLGADGEAAAEAALVEIDRRAALPGGEEFRDRIHHCRTDLAMLADLNRIDDERWTLVNGLAAPPSTIAPHWARAFAGYGIVPGTTSPADVARLLTRSLIRDRILGALELWRLSGRAPGLTEILQEIDPDPFRNALRTEMQRGEWNAAGKRIKDLVEARAARDQPTLFVAAVGAATDLPVNQRRALLEQAATHSPNDAAVLMALGMTYPADQPAVAAERARWFQAAMAVRPQTFAPRSNLAIALWDQGKRDEAIRCFRETTRLYPMNVWGRYNLAKALKGDKDLDGAIAEFHEAIRLAPDELWVRNEFGNALWENQDVDGAIAQYREAIRIDPNFPDAHYNLGNAFREKRKLDDAIAEYREAVRIQPDKADALNALGNGLWDKGDLKGAESCFRKAVESDRDFPSAHNNLGILLKQKGDLPGAIAEYQEVIRIDPKYTRARYNLGIALRANGDVDGAITAFRELLVIDPNHANAHNGLGNALKEKGDLDGAIAEYRAAIRIEPNHAVAKTNLESALKDKAERDRTPPPE